MPSHAAPTNARPNAPSATRRPSAGARRRRFFPLVLLLAFAAYAAPAIGIECSLGPDGAVTTWLVSPARPLDPDAGFSRDLLPERQGEASGARRAEAAGKAGWRARAFHSGYLQLSPDCLRRGESVFYLACELRAARTGPVRLQAAYWARMAAWLDGKPVLKDDGGAEPVVFPRGSAELKLERGKTHHLLVKLGSRNRQALVRLALSTVETDPRVEPRAAPVACILRMPPERTGELLAESLALSARAGELVEPDRLLGVSVRAPAGLPLLEGKVTLDARVLDAGGQLVKTFERATRVVRNLRDEPIPLPWVVPKETKEPTYTVQADVLVGGRQVGRLSKSFYVADGLVGRLKALSGRLEKAELQLGARRRYTEPDLALARLKLEKARLYAQGAVGAGPSPGDMLREMEACGNALDRLENGKARPVTPGLHEYAYLSAIDDAPQPFYVYIPRGHDGRTFLPCVVYLHGYSPDLNKLNWQMIPVELLDYCDRYGFYLLAPFARSNTDFQGVGEVDVIQAFQRLLRMVPVNGNKVYLFGYSMGGMGAFTLGAHYPDVWAGIVSLSGRADYYLWKDLDREKVEPYKRLLIDTEFGAAMPGNFRNLPVLMFHGTSDSLVKIEQPRRFREQLKALGADVTLHELPGQDHWIISRVLRDDAVFKWMVRRKRDPWPTQVDLTAYTIKYRRQYWVTVVDLLRWGEPIKVRARLDPDKTVLTVTTQNVASLRLNLARELVGEKPELTVRINGAEQKVTETGPATFEVAEPKRAGALRKTPRLCGPVKEAFNRRFTVVVGASGKTEAHVERFRDRVMRVFSEWARFTKAAPRFRRDINVTEADIKTSNLLLVGRPANNTVLAKIADKLPVKITDEGFTFQGKTYSNQDHGLVMVYPNPLNPHRAVVVRSGLPYGESLSPNHKYDLLPDFLIFTRGTDYDDTSRAVVAGFFDANWQVDEGLVWRRGEQAPDPRCVKPPDNAALE
jgi:hypothetical protein